MWDATVRSQGTVTTRLGVISPNSGGTTEALYASVAPEGVSFAFTGLGPLPRIGGSIAPALRDVGVTRVGEAAEFLGTLSPDVISVTGSIVGWLEGPEFSEELVGRVEEAAGVPAQTMSASIEAALEELGAERLTVISSYDPTTYGFVDEALSSLGYQVADHTIDRRSSIADEYQLSTDRIYRFTVRRVRREPDTDCVLLLGGSVPYLPLLDDLEAELGVPVVSDGQAGLFGLFRAAGIGPIEGYGELLERV